MYRYAPRRHPAEKSVCGSVLLWSDLASLSRFEEENQRLLELNQRCQFASSATMQWLDIRLQLMGATVVSAIAGIALVQHQQGLANPGAAPGPFTLTSEVGYSQRCPRPLPTLAPRVFTSCPGFSVKMYCNSHHPHFRVEETGSLTQESLPRWWWTWD